MPTETLTLSDGYDRRKTKKRVASFRRMTIEEAKKLTVGQSCKAHTIIANQNTVKDVKVNGKPRVWETDPNQIKIPLKYGLHNYPTAYSISGTEEMNILVIQLTEWKDVEVCRTT